MFTIVHPSCFRASKLQHFDQYFDQHLRYHLTCICIAITLDYITSYSPLPTLFGCSIKAGAASFIQYIPFYKQLLWVPTLNTPNIQISPSPKTSSPSPILPQPNQRGKPRSESFKMPSLSTRWRRCTGTSHIQSRVY